MGLSKEQGNNGYCRIFSKRTGQGSRFPVTECKGFKRVETKLNSFSKNVSSVGTPNLERFRSRVCRQIPAYIFRKLDPHSKGRAAFQTLWSHLWGYAFPPFPLIGRILGKVLTEHIYLILVMTWQAQSLYPRLKNPLFLPEMPGLLVGRNRENFYLIERENFWHGQFP